MGRRIEGRYVSVTVRVHSDAGAIRNLVAGPNGPVAKDLARRAIRVESRAKTLCPVDTGRLRSSIRWQIVRRPAGLVAIIGSDVQYAGLVHNGTRYMRARPFLVDALPAAR